MKVNIINKSSFPCPTYATPQSAGMDIRADLNRSSKTLFTDSDGTSYMILPPGQRCLIMTGLFVALPVGYEIQIRPRSGLAAKKGVTVLNSPGTIDADYRGEIGVIIINHGEDNFRINHGDRIAQMVVSLYDTAEWNEVEELDDTVRGIGGFGHTGGQ